VMRNQPFQGRNTGSIPVSGTKNSLIISKYLKLHKIPANIAACCAVLCLYFKPSCGQEVVYG
jgi:hypothetical protein